MRERVAALYADRGVTLELDEIFVSDGAKSDSSNLGTIFSPDSVVAVQDPAYPVYVDSNVMAGRSGRFDSARQQYEGLVYMPCTKRTGSSRTCQAERSISSTSAVRTIQPARWRPRQSSPGSSTTPEKSAP